MWDLTQTLLKTTLQQQPTYPKQALPINTTQNSFNKNPIKPTKSIKKQEFEEHRLKGLCF
jgi:hypothetical protein